MTGPVVGLIGKLPAHGDFVRRGGPAAVLTMLDGWLNRELGGALADGWSLDDAVDALDGLRCAFDDAGGRTTLACLIASEDGVGRRFPLVATLQGGRGDFAGAEAWCAAAAAALAMIRDAASGDAGFGAISAIDPADPLRPGVVMADASEQDRVTGEPSTAPSDTAPGHARPLAGWWRRGDSMAYDEGLPTGAAFLAVLAGD